MIFGGANFKWNLQQFSVDVEIMIAFFLKSLFIVEKLRYQHFPLETLEECHLIWEPLWYQDLLWKVVLIWEQVISSIHARSFSSSENLDIDRYQAGFLYLCVINSFYKYQSVNISWWLQNEPIPFQVSISFQYHRKFFFDVFKEYRNEIFTSNGLIVVWYCEPFSAWW